MRVETNAFDSGRLGSGCDVHPVSGKDLHHSEKFQGQECFAHHWPADLRFLRQLSVTRQGVSRRKPPVRQSREYLLGDVEVATASIDDWPEGPLADLVRLVDVRRLDQ